MHELEGILQLDPAQIRIIPIPSLELADPSLPHRLGEAVDATEPGIVAAQGLEAYYLLRKVRPGPVVRFAVGHVCREAAQVGVRSTIVVLDEELPRLLAQFPGPAHRPWSSDRWIGDSGRPPGRPSPS